MSRNGRSPFYEEHMRSPWMRALAKSRLAMAGNRCEGKIGGERCPNTRGLDPHHLHYANLGRETVLDIEMLCRDCHKKVHGEAPENGSQLRLLDQPLLAANERAEKAVQERDALLAQLNYERLVVRSAMYEKGHEAGEYEARTQADLEYE